MLTALFLSVAVTVGAPAKDDPKKDPAILGDWIAVKLSVAGMDIPAPNDDELRFSFEKDGKLTITDGKNKPEKGTYKLDLKKDPPEIDMMPPADSKDKLMVGIFTVDGDKLMMCLSEGKDAARPTKFESSKDIPYILMTFKRAKK